MLHIQGTVTCIERGISQTVESKICDTHAKFINGAVYNSLL